MKKIMTLLAAVMLAAGAMAQPWYLGGNISMGTTGIAKNKASMNNFNFSLAPTAGYEFNERWAIEFGGNLNASVYSDKYASNKYTDSNVGGGIFVYGRYTAWNNGLLFIDLKFGDEFNATKFASEDLAVFMPQLRVRVHDHVDLGLNLGKVGLGFQSRDNATYFDYQIQLNAGVSCAYRF